MAEPKYCVVCGMGSHREDWASVKNPACDTHSKAEVEAALAKLAPPPAPPAPPVAPPPAQPPTAPK